MKFVAFYTNDFYRAEADQLIATAAAHDICVHAHRLPDAGSWEHNCAQKAKFVLDQMRDEQGQRVPLVCLDADARIRQKPHLLMSLQPFMDFAAHWLDGHELLSGTLYFGATRRAYKLAEQWHARCVAQPAAWDQEHLAGAVAQMQSDLAICRLPERYTYIFDRGTQHPADIVIEHMQASRRRPA